MNLKLTTSAISPSTVPKKSPTNYNPVIFRILELPESDTYKFPEESRVISQGAFKFAS